MEPIRLRLEGPASVGAMEAVENALRLVPGVISVRADPAAHEVHVTAAESVDADELIKAAQKTGAIATLG
jgi:copper chaperone CopZ